MMKVYNISNLVFEPGLLLNRRRNFPYFLCCKNFVLADGVFVTVTFLNLPQNYYSQKFFSFTSNTYRLSFSPCFYKCCRVLAKRTLFIRSDDVVKLNSFKLKYNEIIFIKFRFFLPPSYHRWECTCATLIAFGGERKSISHADVE